MKMFVAPEVDVIKFAVEDVMTTSPHPDNGENDTPDQEL